MYLSYKTKTGPIICISTNLNVKNFHNHQQCGVNNEPKKRWLQVSRIKIFIFPLCYHNKVKFKTDTRVAENK